ncbi:creatininase family protein [Parvibaculum sp.]|uniref:creatininase family protein n=1 Tax=Parvibaculum sp. TaxID=2024848 RepID=UPI002730B087|nr:creatininase family protein [Parvibaculum sp.]MDP1625717.1 creatininase family protein [Parvibaculum sp.]MDP2149080.1 creatininase family protein [Parvibaculum sp.]MDP3328381.1 creatininase family protein [Parvibaculum sp.]
MTSWAQLTGPQLGDLVKTEGRSLAVLPIGATEQHGPHLATGTDTLLADTICREACRRRGVPMLPALPYGCSYGHTNAWPGTLSLSPETLTRVVCELARWAIDNSGIDRLLFISGHATNGPSIESAILQLRYEYPHARFATRGLWEISDEALRLYTSDAADIHANVAETSMVMAIDPDSVQMERAEDVEDVTVGLIWRYAMPAVTPNGVVGQPSGSSAAVGREMLDRLIQDLETMLKQAEEEAWPAIPRPAMR